MKILNILLGLMKHSSRYPCYACEGTSHEHGIWQGSEKLRTWKSIIQHNADWLSKGKGNCTTLKHFFNCENVPLIGTGEDEPVLFSLPPPSLHLFLSVNHILDSLREEWPELFDWLMSLHIVVEQYFGCTLEGNEVAKVLNNLDSLAEKLPSNLQPFVTLLKSFDEVRKSCFSAKELLPDYEEKIDLYCNAVYEVKDKFGMSITPKLHIVMEHVKTWCKKFNAPLGKFSEQECEAVHYQFNALWTERFIVKDIYAPSYLDQLLKAVLTFNEENI